MTTQSLPALRVAVLRMLQAARDPQCRKLLGPRSRGATQPGGARVPGTCFELAPAEAAVDIALLLAWPAAPGAPQLQLAQLLAQADARARAAVLRGQLPPTVAELLAQWQPEATWPAAEVALADAVAVDALFADAVQLLQMPVQRFVAALVRN